MVVLPLLLGCASVHSLLGVASAGGAPDSEETGEVEKQRLRLCAARPGSAACYGAGGAMEAAAAAVAAEKEKVAEHASDASRSARADSSGSIVSLMAEVEELKWRLQQTPELRLPLSMANIAALAVLLSFTALGMFFAFKLVTRRNCNCKLCCVEYQLINKLGTGGYGSVFTVVRSSDHKVMVLKKIAVDDITDANSAQIEARELRALQHPRIVRYEDDFVHTEWRSDKVGGAVQLEPQFFLMIVMEHCAEGDLSDRINQEFGRPPWSDDGSDNNADTSDEDIEPLPPGPDRDEPVIPEGQVLRWLGQMADALSFVHSKNIIHRDIKSQNFFLTESGDIRLGDFGLCRKEVAHTLTVGGTDVYMAPEMVLGQRYGKEADLWALGCVVFEMCTGIFMWEMPGILGARAPSDPDATAALLRVLPTNYTDGLRDLLKQMLCVDASARPTARAICRSPIVLAAQPNDDDTARKLGLYATSSPRRTRSPFAHLTPASIRARSPFGVPPPGLSSLKLDQAKPRPRSESPTPNSMPAVSDDSRRGTVRRRDNPGKSAGTMS